MIGYIVATHGTLSDGLVSAADLIIGDTADIVTLNLFHGDSIDDLGEKIKEAIKKADRGDGVIILTDLYGASPFNQATIALNGAPDAVREKSYVLTGVNLPMMLEAINQRMLNATSAEAVEEILASAGASVVVWPSGDAGEEDEDEF